MGLCAPVAIDLKNIPLIKFEEDRTYLDPMMGLNYTLHISVGHLGILRPQIDENGIQKTPHIKIDILSEERLHHYTLCQRLISSCANNGEGINRRLIRVNSLLFGGTAQIEENGKLLEVPVHSLGFMRLKNRFIEYLKTDNLYKHLVPKDIRREFEWFVIYRNIFTHGMLRVTWPYSGLYIDYVDHQTRKEEYVPFTKKMINDFQDTYKKFIYVCNEFENIRNTQTKPNSNN